MTNDVRCRPKSGAMLDTDVVTGFKDAILTGPKEVEIEFFVRSETTKNMIYKEWTSADAVLRRFE